MRQCMGILMGGGPAPGVNSVIAAATIRARLEGVEVKGIRRGYASLMTGTADVEPLDIDRVSRIHFRGGCVLGTSRANPTTSARALECSVQALRDAGIDRLLTIGGDDTATSALGITRAAGGAIQVAHVPKTIDNDVDLPPEVDTFGYETARSVGTQIVQNLMVDARTTNRWYLVVAMGRKAGHLALGIGKAAGATLTILPEEFGDHPVTLDTLADTIVGAIIKRRADGRGDGVAIIAEGVCLAIDPQAMAGLGQVERDAHGHVRMAELDLGRALKEEVRRRLDELDAPTTVVSKDLGYELRCADPVPADMEYTRDLGWCAANYLLEGGSGDLITLQQGHFKPVSLDSLQDPQTGHIRVRQVDIASARYAVARRYMIRLRKDDFADASLVERMAACTNLDAAAFRTRFEPVLAIEPPPLRFVDLMG